MVNCNPQHKDKHKRADRSTLTGTGKRKDRHKCKHEQKHKSPSILKRHHIRRLIPQTGLTTDAHFGIKGPRARQCLLPSRAN